MSKASFYSPSSSKLRESLCRIWHIFSIELTDGFMPGILEPKVLQLRVLKNRGPCRISKNLPRWRLTTTLREIRVQKIFGLSAEMLLIRPDLKGGECPVEYMNCGARILFWRGHKIYAMFDSFGKKINLGGCYHSEMRRVVLRFQALFSQGKPCCEFNEVRCLKKVMLVNVLVRICFCYDRDTSFV